MSFILRLLLTIILDTTLVFRHPPLALSNDGITHHDVGETRGATTETPKRRRTISLGHLVCFFFFFILFHITNYVLDIPPVSTTAITHHDDEEMRGTTGEREGQLGMANNRLTTGMMRMRWGV